jgi:hypothetical protein
MARIPDEAIERIKAETDLVALVQSRGGGSEAGGGELAWVLSISS